MDKKSVKYSNNTFQGDAKGVVVGDNNIVHNHFYYSEDVRIQPIQANKVDVDKNLSCPYRGLFRFYPKDAEYFFGRKVFVEKLFKATQNHNFISVLGASGSGKSSVVLAGLVPKLEKEGRWKFTHFVPGSDPFHALALALVPLYNRSDLDPTDKIIQARKLAKYLSNHQDNEDNVPLSDIFATIQQKNPNHRILLIADQFEDLYTQCSDHIVRRRFLDCLLANFQFSNSRASSSTVLVTTMRADFLANALDYRPFANMLQNQDIKLGAMSREELKEVIEKPAEKLEVIFEAGLVERILNDVEDEPGNLPLLEFALTELWEKREGKQLTHDAYDAIGQVKGALADYANDKYKNLTTDEQEQARRIFIQLVRPGEETKDTRRRANREELGEKNWNLITREKGLADSRLVVTSRNDSNQETVEVVHEALIQNWGQLRQWMETDRNFRVWQERLRIAKQEWERTKKDKGSLLRGTALLEAKEKLKERQKELKNEQEFIQASIKEKLNQKTKAFFTFCSLVVVVFGASRFAFIQIQRAERLDLIRLANADGITSDNSKEMANKLPEYLKFVQKNQRVENMDESKGDYRQIIAITNKFEHDLQKPEIWGQFSELEKQQIHTIKQTATSSLVEIIRQQMLPQLEKELTNNNYGKQVQTDFSLKENQYTGALKVTYTIILGEKGVHADRNNDGYLTEGEEKLIPCETIKDIEKRWRKATENRCGLYGDENIYEAQACNELGGITLTRKIFFPPTIPLVKSDWQQRCKFN